MAILARHENAVRGRIDRRGIDAPLAHGKRVLGRKHVLVGSGTGDGKHLAHGSHRAVVEVRRGPPTFHERGRVEAVGGLVEASTCADVVGL